jgi:hypothetical protein
MSLHYYETPGPEVRKRRVEAADQPGQHLWIMLALWIVTDSQMLQDGPVLMDRENLMEVAGPGCFKCERLYSHRLAKQRCKGSVK